MTFPTSYADVLERLECIEPIDYGRTRMETLVKELCWRDHFQGVVQCHSFSTYWRAIKDQFHLNESGS